MGIKISRFCHSPVDIEVRVGVCAHIGWRTTKTKCFPVEFIKTDFLEILTSDGNFELVSNATQEPVIVDIKPTYESNGFSIRCRDVVHRGRNHSTATSDLIRPCCKSATSLLCVTKSNHNLYDFCSIFFIFKMKVKLKFEYLIVMVLLINILQVQLRPLFCAKNSFTSLSSPGLSPHLISPLLVSLLTWYLSICLLSPFLFPCSLHCSSLFFPYLSLPLLSLSSCPR